VMQLLDFVALYGLILMPMGAVIFTDFYLLPRFGLRSNYAEATSASFSIPAALAWGLTLLVCYLLPVDLIFKALPGWFIACGVYLVASKITQKKTVSIANPIAS
jgi:purine-cytosine permease-like protein